MRTAAVTNDANAVKSRSAIDFGNSISAPRTSAVAWVIAMTVTARPELLHVPVERRNSARPLFLMDRVPDHDKRGRAKIVGGTKPCCAQVVVKEVRRPGLTEDVVGHRPSACVVTAFVRPAGLEQQRGDPGRIRSTGSALFVTSRSCV